MGGRCRRFTLKVCSFMHAVHPKLNSRTDPDLPQNSTPDHIPTSNPVHQESPPSPLLDTAAVVCHTHSSRPEKRKTSDNSTSPKKRKIHTINPLEDGWEVQDRGCAEYKTLKPEIYCLACAENSSRKYIREQCRFIHFRLLKEEEHGTYSLEFRTTAVVGGEHMVFAYSTWGPDRTANHTQMIKV
jgi:hypothetical protein